MTKPRQIFQIEVVQDILVLTAMLNLSEFLFECMEEETGKLLTKLQESKIQNIIVDLGKTTYFGTDFLTLLLKLWKRVRGVGGKLVLCNVSPGEREVLQICELHKVWHIANSRDEAMAEIGK